MLQRAPPPSSRPPPVPDLLLGLRQQLLRALLQLVTCQLQRLHHAELIGAYVHQRVALAGQLVNSLRSRVEEHL